jgi:hypothetical protein
VVIERALLGTVRAVVIGTWILTTAIGAGGLVYWLGGQGSGAIVFGVLIGLLADFCGFAFGKESHQRR